MKLIVSAADYAMTPGITDGCIRAIRDGILRDVGLMTNNYEYARRGVEALAPYPQVGLGMDWNLVSGIPACDPREIPDLVDDQGRFLKSQVRKQPQFAEAPYDQIYLEMERQLENFIQLTGRKPDYILGHSWSSPNLIRAGYTLAEKYEVPANLDQAHGFEARYGFKRPEESWYFAQDHLEGQSVAQLMDARRQFNDANIQKAVNTVDFLVEDRGRLLKNEYSLFRCHCGYCDSELFEMSTFNVVRIRDMEALCSPRVREWIQDNGIQVLSMKEAMDEIRGQKQQ